MIKNILPALIVAASAFGALAENETMYLVKGDRVVGKYAVDDVDYATFKLPEGVSDDNIWFTVDQTTKNSIKYTVNTITPLTAYAHNIISFYDVDYMAQDFFGEHFEELSPEQQDYALKLCLQSNGYVGMGTATYTQRDFALDGTSEYSRFNVFANTRYLLCAWEIDPTTYEPSGEFYYTELTTPAAAESKGTLNVSFKRENEKGVAFNVSASGLTHVRTIWGYKSVMEPYVESAGLDLTMATFGQAWDIDFIQATGGDFEGIENATWPAYETADYVLYVRGYDENGDIVDTKVDVHVDVQEATEGPSINILTKDKGTGFVKVNFEISPSNVEEAYVRLMLENNVDDRLNMGYELHELAMGGDAEDITNAINTTGEYTYSNNELDEEWYTIIITALDKDGKRTTQRINFMPDTESFWSVEDPVYKTPAKKMVKIKRINSRRNPSIAK